MRELLGSQLSSGISPANAHVVVACSSAAPDRLRRRIQYSRNLVQHTLPHKVTIHTEAPSRHTYGMISNRPLSRITPQMSFHQRQEMLSWPFVSWAMKAHHHGPELGKLCLRVSSEITIEVILCKYSRRSLGDKEHPQRFCSCTRVCFLPDRYYCEECPKRCQVVVWLGV